MLFSEQGLRKSLVDQAIAGNKRLSMRLSSFSNVRAKEDSIENRELAVLVREADALSSEIALLAAGFACVKCGRKTDLMVHHWIKNPAASLMLDSMFFAQRYYWANCTVLCLDCHKRLEGFDNHEKAIPADRIAYLKQRYYVKAFTLELEDAKEIEFPSDLPKASPGDFASACYDKGVETERKRWLAFVSNLASVLEAMGSNDFLKSDLGVEAALWCDERHALLQHWLASKIRSELEKQGICPDCGFPADQHDDGECPIDPMSEIVKKMMK